MMEEIPFENYRCFFASFFCLVPPPLSLSLSLYFFLSFSLDVSLSFLDCSVENHHHTVANASLCVYNLPYSDKKSWTVAEFSWNQLFYFKDGAFKFAFLLITKTRQNS